MDTTLKDKKFVRPPRGAEIRTVSGRIEGVYIDQDEEIEWHWSHDTDGNSFVSGYTITKKRKG